MRHWSDETTTPDDGWAEDLPEQIEDPDLAAARRQAAEDTRLKSQGHTLRDQQLGRQIVGTEVAHAAAREELAEARSLSRLGEFAEVPPLERIADACERIADYLERLDPLRTEPGDVDQYGVAP